MGQTSHCAAYKKELTDYFNVNVFDYTFTIYVSIPMKNSLILILAMALSMHCAGQSLKDIDSLKRELAKTTDKKKQVDLLIGISIGYFDNNATLSFQHAEQALTLARNINYEKGIVDGLNEVGVHHWIKGDYQIASSTLEQALAASKKLGFTKKMAGLINNIGALKKDQGLYAEALEKYFEALKLNEQMGNKKWMANNYSNIANIYAFYTNFSECLKYNYKALKIAEALKDQEGIGMQMSNIGSVYVHLSDYPAAFRSYYKALEIFTRAGNRMWLAGVNAKLGEAYQVTGKYDSSLQFLLQASEDHRAVENMQGLCENETIIGYTYLRQKKYGKAIEAANRSLKIAHDLEFEGVITPYLLLSECYLALGETARSREYIEKTIAMASAAKLNNVLMMSYEIRYKIDSSEKKFDQSLDNYKTYTRYRDSVFNLSNTQKITSQQLNYEF